jgi:hypothetical protein
MTGRFLTNVVGIAFGLSAGLLFQAESVRAAGIDGAWATNTSVCSKVFAKRGDRIAVTKDADLYGSGFVIDGKHIRGKVLTCAIKTRKQDGNIVHIIAICSNDVALQNYQFTVKLDEENKITRTYPGLPELDTPYYRCLL